MLSFFFSSRRRHTRCLSDWSSDVWSSDLRQNLQMNRQIDRCCQMQLNKQTTRMNLDLQNTAAEEQPKLARDLQANPADEEIDRSEERRVGKERDKRRGRRREKETKETTIE